MALPYLKEFGWEAAVLAITPSVIEGMPLDLALTNTVPDDVEIARVGALPAGLTRVVGLGNLALRALPFLWKAGSQLLAKSYSDGRPIDLVFFSTTQFPVMTLGPIWKRKFGGPYVVEMQDLLRARDVQRVDLWKLDVEGFEVPALEGAGTYLTKRRIGALYVELSGDNGRRIREYLGTKGYGCHLFDRGGKLRPASDELPDHTNGLFLPQT